MAILLGSPRYIPPRPRLDAGWTPLTHTLTGADGTSWVISDYRTGAFLQQGVRGLHNPPFKHYRDTHAGVRGSTWRGVLEEARECFWPIYLYSDLDSEEWITRHNAFWQLLNPYQEATWTVRAGNFSTRRLRVRLEDRGDHQYAQDPLYVGWATYGVTLTADQPLWEGDPIVQDFNAGNAVKFTGTAGGPPFYISPRETTATATISNPGDVDTHLIWRVGGPHPTGVTLGFGGNYIDVPFEIKAGERLTIDTRPGEQTALMQNGVERTGELLPRRSFKALPAGADIKLNLAISGTGPISAELTPLYWKAM